MSNAYVDPWDMLNNLCFMFISQWRVAMMNEKTDCLDASEQSISHCLDASEQSIFSLSGRVRAVSFSLPGRVGPVNDAPDQ